MRPPVRQYKGDEPFVFVSYSHADKDKVFQAIEQLTAQYFRIWYDEGIPAGNVWEKELENRIRSCQCILFFQSSDSASSIHVARELEAAKNYEKQIIPVIMEDANLPPDVASYVNSFQKIELELAADRGSWSGLVDALPKNTQEFTSLHQKLNFLESGMNDPLVLELLRESGREELGWCSMHKSGDDTIQTCRLCGETDWFSPGLSPSRSCPKCGLSRNPGKAKPWFSDIRSNWQSDSVSVTCTSG